MMAKTKITKRKKPKTIVNKKLMENLQKEYNAAKPKSKSTATPKIEQKTATKETGLAKNKKIKRWNNPPHRQCSCTSSNRREFAKITRSHSRQRRRNNTTTKCDFENDGRNDRGRTNKQILGRIGNHDESDTMNSPTKSNCTLFVNLTISHQNILHIAAETVLQKNTLKFLAEKYYFAAAGITKTSDPIFFTYPADESVRFQFK